MVKPIFLLFKKFPDSSGISRFMQAEPLQLASIGIQSIKISRSFVCLLLLIGVTQGMYAQSVPKKRDSVRHLQNVTVTGTVTERSLKQQPINISIIDAKPFYNTNVTGLDLLKQVSGIKIKQDGGFGAQTEFFINGSTGKQVKFFIDGLPQDNLGETQLLNVYPVEQTERIEVYKGVLPVDLGADALGAAINIVTRKEKQDYFDGSYSIASFNIHRLNLSGKKYLSKHCFIGAQLNANYAKNNYKIDAEVPNQTGNIEIEHVARFHDVYRNYNVKLQAGVTDKRYADQLLFSLITTGLYDELQNNLVQTQPYGKAFYKENLLSGIVRYQKDKLFKRVDLSSFLSFNRVNGLFMDTSKNIYNWEGRVVDRRFSGGEIVSSGNALHIYTNVFNGKLTATYHLSDACKLVFSNTFQQYSRTGEDTVAKNYYNGKDFYGTPSSLQKNIAGMGIDANLPSLKLKFSAAVKHYYTHLTGYELQWSLQTITSRTLQSVGYNAAIGYKMTDRLLFKTSYEHAARLPEAAEAFGDLMVVRSNPVINIEKSENINLGGLYNGAKVDVDAGVFYRNVSNIIYLRTAQTSSQYQNLLSARVTGAEGVIKYRPVTGINLFVNATYQNLRNQSVIDNSGINNDRYKNARLPNIPYLFMNGGVMYRSDHFFKKPAVWQVWWNSSYTHEYFLYWESEGARELKNRIPVQLLHYAGISFAPAATHVTFALEAANIFNATAYDNFKVQLPGRSVSFKIRWYQFSKK